MRSATYTRLQRLRADLSCPHCGERLRDPPTSKLNKEQLDEELNELIAEFRDKAHHDAMRAKPEDRTLDQWVSVTEVPDDITGTELVERLSRLRDEVAEVVR